MVTGDVTHTLLREKLRKCRDGWLIMSNLGYYGYGRTFLCVTLETGFIGFYRYRVSGENM
jgi:hypothetical protein